MSQILKITASNFRSFRELSYSIDQYGLVAVEGVYEGTSDRSNGSGKSACTTDLLCWAIYGETTGGKKQVCSTYEWADKVVVEVETPFVSWTRSQKRDGTGNHLEVGGVRKLKDAEAELTKYFPSKRIFASTTILGQGIGERFSSWTPATRAQELADLLNLSLWSQARKRLAGDRSRLATESARLDGSVAAYEQQLNQLTSAPQGDPKKKVAAEKKLLKLNKQLSVCQADYSQLSAAVATLMQAYGSLQARQSQIQVELASSSRGTATECPTCGRPYEPEDVAAAQHELQLRHEKATQELRVVVDQMAAKLEEKKASDAALAAKSQEVAVLQSKVTEVHKEITESQSFADQIASVRKNLVEHQGALNKTKQSISDLNLLDRAFTEIPVRKIDTVLGVLNARLVGVCNDIWESEFLVQLTSEHDLKKGGTKAEIGLVVESQAGDYKGSSPGQQRKIDLTIQLALRDLLMSSGVHTLPLLICDDVVDVLDPWARRKLYTNYLKPLSEKSSVLVLTPAADYPIPVEHRIVVGYSEVVGSRILSSSAEPVVVFNA